MIDRDQVLHVARLARLRLSDDEVDAMVEELPKILGHIETMETLDLEGVEPTSHVVQLENVLREDVPQAEPAGREGAGAGARSAARRIRRAEPGTLVSDGPARAERRRGRRALVRAGELSAAELFEFWRGRAAGDELGSYLWVADGAGRRPTGRRGRSAACRWP